MHQVATKSFGGLIGVKDRTLHSFLFIFCACGVQRPAFLPSKQTVRVQIPLGTPKKSGVHLAGNAVFVKREGC